MEASTTNEEELTLSYDNLMTWRSMHLVQSRVPAVGQVDKGGGHAMFLYKVRKFNKMTVTRVILVWFSVL